MTVPPDVIIKYGERVAASPLERYQRTFMAEQESDDDDDAFWTTVPPRMTPDELVAVFNAIVQTVPGALVVEEPFDFDPYAFELDQEQASSSASSLGTPPASEGHETGRSADHM